MAELDATQMPEEITPSAEVNTPDLNTTEETSPDLITAEEPAVEQEPQGKQLSKEELAKRYLPKTRTNISTETSKIQTSAEPASTAVAKPAPVKLKSTNLLTQTQEEADKEAYKNKKLEYLLAPKDKKPEFKVNAKIELEQFLGGKIGKIDWNAYDKSKLQEEREAIKAQIEKDVDPNYDPSGVLTFINMITPNALKSGVASMGSQLAGFAGAAAQYLDKASKQSVAGAAFGETKQEKEARQTTTTEDLYKSLYTTAVSLDKKSQDYMMVAEKNSGIKEENIGKGAFELMASDKPGDTWDGLKKLGLSVTQQMPQLIALAATGGSTAGIMAGSGVLGTGGAITEEYKKDQDISVADAWQSVAKGVIEGATEAIFVGDIKALRSIGGNAVKLDMSGAKKTMSDYLKQRGRKALEQEINRTYFQSIGTVLKNSLGEGSEEIIASVGGFIVDRIEDGKWDQEEYNKLMKETKEAFLVGAATGFTASAHAIKTSVTPLTTEQKRKIISFRQVANDETVDKDVRKLAQKHADDIINYNADLATRKYSVISALPIEKRKIALSIENKIKGLEGNKAKLKNVDAEAQVDKDVAKLKEDWSKLVVEHAVETAKADAKAKAEKIASAPKVMTSNSTEVSTATEAMEVDESMIEGDFDLLKGLSLEQKQTLINIQKAMQTINPDGKVVMYANEDEMRKGLINSGLSQKEAYERAASSSAEFTVKSSGADPIVHVNLSNTQDAVRSASHEVAHLALLELSKSNPEAFIAMRDKVLRVMKNSQANPLIEFANQYSAKLETDEAKQERAEEFLVEMIAALTSGNGKIERTILDQLARIIRDFLLQASRSFGNKNLEDFINKTFADTTSSEALANYFESLAKQLKVGGKIDVSTLSDVIPLTPAQEARLQGLTPGTDAYHQAAMTNAVENSPSAARPTMEADQSLVQNPDDVVSRSQLAESNFIESPQFKKYLKVVKGMTPADVWLGRALFMDENRGGKMFASGSKEEIIEQMKKEMDQIEADANNSNKYYITELKPPYIAAQIAKFEKDPALTDNLTEWKMIRDDASMRDRYIKEKAAEQKAALTGNIAYLKGNDTYSIPFQYAMIKDGISSRYTIEIPEDENAERKIQRDSIKPSQLNSTEKPITTIQPGIASSAYADYADLNTEPGRGYLVAQINMPKVDVNQSEFAPFVFKVSDTGEGHWLKFNQSSDPKDAEPLHKIANTSHKYPAQWCTGGALVTAEGHLSGGDFYIFVDNKTGDARVAVRYNGKERINEVRGLGAGQALLPNDAGIVNEIVASLPGGKEYAEEAKLQDKLKEILDALPNEVAKQKFILEEREFYKWLTEYARSQNTDPANIKKEIGIRETLEYEANDAINEAVKSNIVDKVDNIEELVDFLKAKDRSYNQRNYALSNTKDAIRKSLLESPERFGYKPGEIYDGSKGMDFTHENYDKIKLIMGSPYIYTNRGELSVFKSLERIIGRLKLDEGANIAAPLLKSAEGIDLPTTGDYSLSLPSLENLTNDKLSFPQNFNYKINLDLPKIKSITAPWDIFINKDSSLNIPSVTNISDHGMWMKYNINVDKGKFNAPELLSTDLSLNLIGEKGVNNNINISKLQNAKGITTIGLNLELPDLKQATHIDSRDGSNIKLNDVEFIPDKNGASPFISASTYSSVEIKKLSAIRRESGMREPIELKALGNSNIYVDEQVREEIKINEEGKAEGDKFAYGGISKVDVAFDSKIEVNKGFNLSWADINISDKSKFESNSLGRVQKLELNKATLNNSKITQAFTIVLTDSKIDLPNLENCNTVQMYGDNEFSAEKLIGSSFSIFNSTKGVFTKINTPGARYLHKVILSGALVYFPHIDSLHSVKLSHASVLNAPDLTGVSELEGEGLGTLNAPNLNQINKIDYGGDKFFPKIFAPKLGYNGTSTPDATIAKSQMSKDIKKLEDAIHTVRMAPSVKFWMEPEFMGEASGTPKTGNPSTVVFTKQKNSEGISDFVAYYSEKGKLVSTLSILTEPNKEAMSSKGAFKITTDPAEKGKGYATILLNAAQDNGLDIIGNIKANRFSTSGRDLVTKWLKSKMDAMIEAKAQLMTSEDKSKEIADALSKASGTTQVATTTGSYEKVAKILKGLGIEGDVLDYGAGFGLGTDAMSKVLGKQVKSLEINPEGWKGKGKVTYTDSNKIDQRFDAIVSLNVVNVVPKEKRDYILNNIFDNLNIGGTAVISSRKFKGDIDQAKNFELGVEDKSYIIKRKKNGAIVDVYQKGFDGDELVDYVKGLLGDAATVKKNNTFGAAGVVITKNAELPVTAKSQLAPNGKPSNLNRAQYETVRTPEFKAWFGDWENDPENASKFVDENGEPQVFYHGTYAEFERFSTDPEFKRHAIHNQGIFFTPTVTGAKSYGNIQMPVFLNAKSVDYNTADINNSFKAEREKENNLIDNTDKEGVVLNTIDKESITVGDKDGMVKQYVVFDPNQILLAGDKTYAKSQLLDRFKKFASQIANKPSGELLAPNGKPSNLAPGLYDMVRKPTFKKWFGDWEKGEGSVALDENKEPLVVFHSSLSKDIDKFNGYVTYFTDNKDYAKQVKGFKDPSIYGAFLNIRSPYNATSEIADVPAEVHLSDQFTSPRFVKENTTGYDAVIGVDAGQKQGKTYSVFNPDQIKVVSKSQLAAPMYAGKVTEEDRYLPGTSAAKKAEEEADKPQSVKEVIQLFEKEFTERNVHIADFMKNADMMQSMYNMYNKAGATPWATRMFADAYRDVYGKVAGKDLSKKDKGFLDDVILLRRIIAIDENFDNRKEKRPVHTSFVDYETKKEVQLSKEEALRQLDLLKTKVYASNPAKFDELEYRAEKYFEAFSGILKFKLDNGIITQDEYDMYKNYNYQPRKFLKFILADTKPDAFNTRGVQIKKKEFTKIESGDDGYMMTDSEKLLKMGFVSAVNQVFSNRAKRVIFDELAGRDLGWAKPAKVDTYANGTPKLEADGSPKLLEPSAGYRNITFKVNGKRNAFQMKESLAKEFEDVEMYNLKNWFYKLSVAAMGAKLTSAMAVGISPAFIFTNIPTDVFSQVHVNNLFNSRFGAPGQLVKGFTGTSMKSLQIAKAKTGLGDNSRILNLINDYGRLGGLQNTLAYDTNIFGKVGDALGMLGDISELASKLNAFEKRRAGLLENYIKKNKANPSAEEYEKIQMQAAYEARAAMDFNRGGRVTKFMNAFLPFLNVGAQATKLTTSYVKNNFPAFTKKIMQAGLPYMGLTLYNLMVSGDDWENEDIKRDKKNKIIIMSPYKNADGTHSYTKLQIPAAIKVFFNVFSIIAENIYYSQIASAQGVKVPAVDKSMTKELVDNLKMFVPAVKSTLMPPSAKFFEEYSSNESIFNERSLSQDALRKIIITQEGEENPDVLSLYKILAKNTAEITKDTWASEVGIIGKDGIEISPERFQKAAEDSWFTSPESQALLSTMYMVADQMTNFAVGGVDEKLRSKYLGNGDYSGVMEAWGKSFKNRLIGKTDKRKNELYYDMKEDMEMIERVQRQENSVHQDIAYKIKSIFKSYKELELPYTAAKPEISEFYKSIKDSKDKEYAKDYIEMMIGNLQVELKNNIPKYRLILREAKSARSRATAIYSLFTMRGQDPMKDKTLQKDLAKMGFSGEVVKQYRKIAKIEDEKKGVDVIDNIDPETGLPPGFNPEDYK